MFRFDITLAHLFNGILILLTIFFVRCSDGVEVLTLPDRNYLAFLHGDIGSADLRNLDLSSGTLTPGFASGTTYYTAAIDITVASISVTPTTADKNAIAAVNGLPAVSGQPTDPIGMAYGENLITVDVTSSDGLLTKTYYANVYRCDLDNANLTGLILSSGTLDPAFDTDTETYTAYIDISVPSITVTPTASEPYATIRVNGTVVLSGQASPDIPMATGQNTITVEVLSYDGSVSRTYTVNVIKCEPQNADLSNLVLSTGNLSPSFTRAGTAYTSNVHFSVGSITLTPTAVDPYATIRVGLSPVNSGQPSGGIGLIDGLNPTIDTVVTSPDGSVTKTYSVSITRLDMLSTNLSSLVITDQSSSPVPSSPSFSEDLTSYTATVDNSATSVTVTPAAVSGGSATITVNGAVVGSGDTSGPIPINHGVNTITVNVTNGVFVPQTYTVTINQYEPANANLSGITLSNGTLSPAFSEGTSSYAATVDTGSITVTPAAAEPYAAIQVNGETVSSGQPSASIPMNIGSNLITIVVTSYDGSTTQTYTITANRTAILATDFVSALSIRLDTTSSGAGVSGTVTNFPVLIRLTNSAIIDAVRSDADDIRFGITGGNTWLSYEIERWDQANNLAEVWVLVPAITGNGNTYITMYYNDAVNDAVPGGQNAAAVFSSSNGFAAVYHMNQNPAGGTGAVRDSSSSGLHGTSAGSMTSGDQITGQIAGSLDFDGSNDEINLGTSASLQPSSLTASFWVKKPEELLGLFNYNRIFLSMKSASSGNGWYIDYSPGLVTGIGAVPLRFYVNGSNYWYADPSLISLGWLFPSDVWVYITVTFDTSSDSCQMYKNGETISINQSGGTFDVSTTTGSKYIAGGDFNSNLNGSMDEVRISSVVRTADWVKLEFENQKTNQSLVKF